MAADQDLSRFRYHTGATLRRLAADEACPRLFRDIGPQAMAEFLGGRLVRLAGPTAPILYMRTVDYREPYTDYERIGRLVFLEPRNFAPWHSGIPTVYVASVHHPVASPCVGFVPGEVSLAEADRLLDACKSTDDLRETFGGRAYDELRTHTAARLTNLCRELAEVERRAEPVRRRLQSGDVGRREELRNRMEAWGVTEHDLCAAWHHVPQARRERFVEFLEAEGAA